MEDDGVGSRPLILSKRVDSQRSSRGNEEVGRVRDRSHRFGGKGLQAGGRRAQTEVGRPNLRGDPPREEILVGNEHVVREEFGRGGAAQGLGPLAQVRPCQRRAGGDPRPGVVIMLDVMKAGERPPIVAGSAVARAVSRGLGSIKQDGVGQHQPVGGGFELSRVL